MPSTPDLSVVIPAHNEAPNLRVLLPQLKTILDEHQTSPKIKPGTFAAASAGDAATAESSEETPPIESVDGA